MENIAGHHEKFDKGLEILAQPTTKNSNERYLFFRDRLIKIIERAKQAI